MFQDLSTFQTRLIQGIRAEQQEDTGMNLHIRENDTPKIKIQFSENCIFILMKDEEFRRKNENFNMFIYRRNDFNTGN